MIITVHEVRSGILLDTFRLLRLFHAKLASCSWTVRWTDLNPRPEKLSAAQSSISIHPKIQDRDSTP